MPGCLPGPRLAQKSRASNDAGSTGFEPAPRKNEQFYNTVGAAFYHMRKRGEAVTDRFSNTRATKWSQDAEAPAGTGASDGEEPSEGSFWKEGGTGYDPAPPDGRGADTGDTESRHGHGNGASISEAPAL